MVGVGDGELVVAGTLGCTEVGDGAEGIKGQIRTYISTRGRLYHVNDCRVLSAVYTAVNHLCFTQSDNTTTV